MVAPSFEGLALSLADAAREVTLAQVQGSPVAENKGNAARFDPVTVADRSAEHLMRGMIGSAFPEHSILGEEFGDELGSSQYAWSLDPIDGTRSYVCGLPTWTTLIALLDNGRPILGLIDAPALGERYFGAGTVGWCETDNRKTDLGCSTCTRISEARISTTDPFLFGGDDARAFNELQNSARITRYGLDGYAYARLALGTLDLVVECGLKPHDYNALIPIVRAAGGTFGDWFGGTDFANGDVIAAATPQLYEAAVAIMSGSNGVAAGPR